MEGKYEYILRLRLDILRRDKDILGFFQRSFTRDCPADRGWTWTIPHIISIIQFTLPGSLHFLRAVIISSLQQQARLASDRLSINHSKQVTKYWICISDLFPRNSMPGFRLSTRPTISLLDPVSVVFSGSALLLANLIPLEYRCEK